MEKNKTSFSLLIILFLFFSFFSECFSRLFVAFFSASTGSSVKISTAVFPAVDSLSRFCTPVFSLENHSSTLLLALSFNFCSRSTELIQKSIVILRKKNGGDVDKGRYFSKLRSSFCNSFFSFLGLPYHYANLPSVKSKRMV